MKVINLGKENIESNMKAMYKQFEAGDYKESLKISNFIIDNVEQDSPNYVNAKYVQFLIFSNSGNIEEATQIGNFLLTTKMIGDNNEVVEFIKTTIENLNKPREDKPIESNPFEDFKKRMNDNVEKIEELTPYVINNKYFDLDYINSENNKEVLEQSFLNTTHNMKYIAENISYDMPFANLKEFISYILTSEIIFFDVFTPEVIEKMRKLNNSMLDNLFKFMAIKSYMFYFYDVEEINEKYNWNLQLDFEMFEKMEDVRSLINLNLNYTLYPYISNLEFAFVNIMAGPELNYEFDPKDLAANYIAGITLTQSLSQLENNLDKVKKSLGYDEEELKSAAEIHEKNIYKLMGEEVDETDYKLILEELYKDKLVLLKNSYFQSSIYDILQKDDYNEELSIEYAESKRNYNFIVSLFDEENKEDLEFFENPENITNLSYVLVINIYLPYFLDEKTMKELISKHKDSITLRLIVSYYSVYGVYENLAQKYNYEYFNLYLDTAFKLIHDISLEDMNKYDLKILKEKAHSLVLENYLTLDEMDYEQLKLELINKLNNGESNE